MTTAAPALDLRRRTQRVFAHLLASTLTVSVVNFTVWFAVTFWVFLETRSIMATRIIAQDLLAATSHSGIPFGGIVDHFGRRRSCRRPRRCRDIYLGCLGTYLLVPAEEFRDREPGAVGVRRRADAGRDHREPPRTIALPTLVTLLVPAPVQDRITAWSGQRPGCRSWSPRCWPACWSPSTGCRSVLVVAVVALERVAAAHLARVRVPSRRQPGPSADGGGRGIDLRGTLRVSPLGARPAGADRVHLRERRSLLGRRCSCADGPVRPVAGVGQA
ncbi:hypothetical protein HBB16_05905 [Pseudonocardia sp. MCCB 268]|nr:hypothetical protein [Pseudonocardia cytotoxica]